MVRKENNQVAIKKKNRFITLQVHRQRIPKSVSSEINVEMVRQAALRTKGEGGISWIDVNDFRRILAYKSFNQSSLRLCEAIVTLIRTPKRHFVTMTMQLSPGCQSPDSTEQKQRCCKANRSCGGNKEKLWTSVQWVWPKRMLSIQRCGKEVAIHTTYDISEADDTDAIVLFNAFGALKCTQQSSA